MTEEEAEDMGGRKVKVRFVIAATVWRVGCWAHDVLWLPLGVSGWLFDRAEAIDRRVAG